MLLLSVMLFGGARIAAGLDKPHILFLLIDDFGWADAGWHRPANYSEVKTPHMDELVRNGIELDRNMVKPPFLLPSLLSLSLSLSHTRTHTHTRTYRALNHTYRTR